MTVSLANTVRIRSNFTRSVHVERDASMWLGGFRDYIITPLARQILGRVLEGVRSPHSPRAWTLTGPYGSGKSAFALALVQLLAPGKKQPPLLQALHEEDSSLAAEVIAIRSEITFLPVLVSGQRRQLTPALLEGLIRALEEHGEGRPAFADLLVAARQTDPEDAGTVTSLYETAARLTGGLVLIVDELGKFLEYAGQRPDKADVFALQLLGEAAARSTERPMLVLTVLHQAFSLYGSYLTRTQREEFNKVQGRFDDIAFQQPVDQMLRLVSAAIDFDPDSAVSANYRARAVELARQAIALQLVPTSLSEKEVIDLLVGCAPLHPVTALLLGPLFKRLAQNERSVFAFLGSHEPFGFQEFLVKASTGECEFYTPDRLYDYVLTSCGSWLYQDPVDGRRWAQVETTLERLRDMKPLEARVVKTVGLMAAIGEMGEMKPSREVLPFALLTTKDQVHEALSHLVAKSVVVHRSFLGSYRLWDGSDVDLEEELASGRRQVDTGKPLVDLLAAHVPPRPVVARRHSYQKGTLRFFQVQFTSPEQLLRDIDKFQKERPHDADGLLVYLLVDSEAQLLDIEQLAGTEPLVAYTNVVMVPIHLSRSVRETALEREALLWVESNTPALRDDRVARRELKARLSTTEQMLSKYIEAALSPSLGGLLAFHAGTRYETTGAKDLNQLLSRVCDQLYPDGPSLRNELINRQNISSAAAAARRVLLSGMIERSHLPKLGITGFQPELSMYRSLLENTGIHQEANGEWKLVRPIGDSPLVPVWKVWERFLESTLRQKRSLAELWKELSAPPVGLKNGVIPVFICAMLLERQLDVALYEVGSFEPDLTTAMMERLVKSPDKFEIRYCPIQGIRADVFEALQAHGFGNQSDRSMLTLMRRLMRFAKRLPEYSDRTRSISPEAQEMRRVLKSAREPEELLFVQLPKVVGMEGFGVTADSNPETAREYAQRLQGLVRELHLAYDRLVDRLTEIASSIMGVSNCVSEARKELQARANTVIGLTADLGMKAFVNRVGDSGLDDRAWIEALATYLVSRHPRTWYDDDLGRFETEFVQYSLRFKNLEDLALAVGRVAQQPGDSVTAMRVGVTTAGGHDYHQVVIVSAAQRAEIEAMKDTVLALIGDLHGDSKLAALTEALKSLLEPQVEAAERDLA